MSNEKRNSKSRHANSMDVLLNQDQENEISRPESLEEVGFDVKADDLVHQPDSTSQEHSLDDTHETLTQPGFDKNELLAVAEDAMKKPERD